MFNKMKLSEVAKKLGVTKKTLYNWKEKGKIHFEKIGSLNYVNYEEYANLAHIKIEKEEKVVIYARVSSTVNKNNLDSQVERLKLYCLAKGYKIHKIVKEFGSGISDNRSKLVKLLKDGDFTKIVIEHKDRLTRIGFNYIKILLNKDGKEIEIINNSESTKEEIIEDFVSIITSYCTRIYGNRRSKRKTELLIQELENRG